MIRSELSDVLAKHRLWLNGDDGGVCASLRGADLIDADLTGADLTGAHLRGADLRSAGLRYADLRYADLRGADLRSADLRRANLRSTDLREARMRGANLRYADLTGAHLRYADLRGADIDFACWPLWCGSRDVVVDPQLARQLIDHVLVLVCDDEEIRRAQQWLREHVTRSHRARDLLL